MSDLNSFSACDKLMMESLIANLFFIRNVSNRTAIAFDCS